MAREMALVKNVIKKRRQNLELEKKLLEGYNIYQDIKRQPCEKYSRGLFFGVEDGKE